MKKILSFAFATALLAGILVPGLASSGVADARAPQADAGKVTICHKTGSETNPWVIITISANGLNGHFNEKHHDQQDHFAFPDENGDCPAGEDGGEVGEGED